MPQDLPYLSEHAFSCRASIYTGEVTRHLINCSAPSDYDTSLSELRDALVKRGYPSALLEHIPYDKDKRDRLLSKFRQRDRIALISERASRLLRMYAWTIWLFSSAHLADTFDSLSCIMRATVWSARVTITVGTGFSARCARFGRASNRRKLFFSSKRCATTI